MRFITPSILTIVLALGCDSRTTAPQDGGVDSAADQLAEDLGADSGADMGEGPHCDPALVMCRSMPPWCRTGEIASVDGSCWGPCVEVARCVDLPERPNCDLSEVSCEMMEPSCIEGYFPTAEGFCYGPCVPVSACACTAADVEKQCPVSDFLCWTVGFCGPLV